MRSSASDEILLSAVESALLTVFSRNVEKAVNFYVDKQIALRSPSDYTNSMQLLFGEGARVLIEKIIEVVSKSAGLDGGAFSSLEDCVREAQAKLQAPPG